MATICCTQKLLTELRVKPDLSIDTEETGWHANLVRFERRKCVLFTHDETLFSFFEAGLKRPDFDQFSDVFGQRLFKALLNEGFSQRQIECMLDTTRQVHFAKTRSRSVLGSMNDMARMLEIGIYSDGGLAAADLAYLNGLINRTPFKAIGNERPLDRMRIFLSATE